MVKSILVATAFVATASAFAPAQSGRAATSLNEFAGGLPGGDNVEPMFIGETGSKNFDPVGFSEVRRRLRI